MKEIRIRKEKIKKIFIIISLTVLLLWLGLFLFSYYSMRSDTPYIALGIDMQEYEIVDKVAQGFPRKSDEYIEYDFSIIFQSLKDTDKQYGITGVGYDYYINYRNEGDAQFELLLDKDKGEFNFSDILPDEPVLITLRYDIEKDFRYYWDVSWCVFKRAMYNVLDIYSSCSRGNCIVERELSSWKIERIDKTQVEKKAYFQSYDRDFLIRSLFNYHITDDFGYFEGNSFKAWTQQSSFPDGTHKLGSKIIKERDVPSGLSATVPWILGITSEIDNKMYKQYMAIDLMSYMEEISSYASDEIGQTFFDCEIAYETVNNLKECDSTTCDVIQSVAFEHCKKVIEYEISLYDDMSMNYWGYDYESSSNAFLLYLPSEMLFFNRMVDILKEDEAKYEKDQIYEYYLNAKKMESEYPSVITSCYLLKVMEDMYMQYKEKSITSEIATVYESLPNFTSFCNGTNYNEYCSLSISKRLVCADALYSSYPNISEKIIYDIFYKHYFLSPASFKLDAYEGYRASPLFNKNVNGLQRIDEYGYLVYRKEVLDVEGLTAVSFADMIDNYYFVYLINKFNGE